MRTPQQASWIFSSKPNTLWAGAKYPKGFEGERGNVTLHPFRATFIIKNSYLHTRVQTRR
jgi:hypothetical protein